MRKWILLLCLLLAASLPAVADSGALRVDFSPYCDVPILLYAVARQNAQGNLVFAEPFTGCDADISDRTAQGQTQAARSLAAWAEEKALTPDCLCDTDEAGNAAFEDLSPGLYLVSAQPFRIGTQVVTANPFLVHLPSVDAAGQVHWTLTAQMKFTVQPDDPDSPDTGPSTMAVAGLILAAGALFTMRKREKT
ncbi:MAG: LPXTG cell wall anchor domain-containing protein [Oscillospiraceae bacterium]|nr:LPXTG cell wall anchor domain-containing protein [Oscillospiraceae bacterium]